MDWKQLYTKESLKKGKELSDGGRVANISIVGDVITANIQGRNTYDLKLIVRNGLIIPDCSYYDYHLAALMFDLEKIGKIDKINNAEFYSEIEYSGQVELKKYFGTDEVITIPEGVQAILPNAFTEITNIKSILLPKSIESIGMWAFSGFSNLEKINISENVKIGEGAFTGCRKLKWENGFLIRNNVLYASSLTTGTLIVPEGVTKIGREVFLENEFDSIILPSTLEEIGERAFEESSKLKSIVFPDSCKNIGISSFAFCYALEEISLPKVVSNDSSTFFCCESLKKVTLAKQECTRNGNSYYSTFYGCTGLEEAIIPSGVKSLDYTFSGCENLEKVVFKGKTTKVKQGTFDGCEKLKIYCDEAMAKKLPEEYQKFVVCNDADEVRSNKESIEPKKVGPVLYKNIDNMDIDQMLRDCGGSTNIDAPVFPNKRSVKVDIGGNKFKANYKVGEDLENNNGISIFREFVDLYEAVDKLMTHSETQDMVYRNDDSSDAFAYVSESVHPDAATLSKDIVQKRYKFIFAMANILADEAVIKRIIEEAPKKKDGTFNKSKVYRIASTGMVERGTGSEIDKIISNEILEIYAKAKTDTILEIYGRKRNSGEAEIQNLQEDFVTTHFDELGLGKYL